MVASRPTSATERSLDLRSPPHSADRVRFSSEHYIAGLDEGDDEAPTQRISAIRLGPTDEGDEDADSTHSSEEPSSPAQTTPSAPRARFEGVAPAKSPVANWGPRAGVPSTSRLASQSRQPGSVDPLAAGPPDVSPSFSSFASFRPGPMDPRPSLVQQSMTAQRASHLTCFLLKTQARRSLRLARSPIPT